jgi:tripartite-type tricarboxylate transporter receptor subunit TctC
VKVWEEAFSKAVNEPAYIDWAKKRKIALHLLSAHEFAKVVLETYSNIEKFQKILKE